MRIALVHDYLVQHGGAERVLEALLDLYPTAAVWTSVADLDTLPDVYAARVVHQSALGHVPGAVRFHRALVPLYPALFWSLGRALREYDVVISDSSAWSHHSPVRSNAVHVCYCHTPPRFLYRDLPYLMPATLPGVIRPVAKSGITLLRWADRRAASRVDHYVANSRTVAARIATVYGRTAPVVYPPVDVSRFAVRTSTAPEDWYLVVSRLVPHKRIDLAIQACTRSGRSLKVIGDGRSFAALQRLTGPGVEFLGRLDDASTAAYFARCRALILPAAEDFGITAIEAQAAGRPVVAFGAAGALETVIPGETGLFFAEPTVTSLVDALDRLESRSWIPDRCRANAARFGIERFQREIAAQVDAAWSNRERPPG